MSDLECRQLRGAYVTGPLIEQLLGDAVRLSASREGSRKPPWIARRSDLHTLFYSVPGGRYSTIKYEKTVA